MTSSPIQPLPRRRALLRALAGAAVALPWLGARAGFNFFTSEYTATREELQAQVAKHFPLDRGGNLFGVRLRDPQLGLDATTNRAAITATLTIETSLPQPVQGLLTISSALRYDPATHSIRLEQPKAERVELQGVAGREAELLQRIGGLVAQELLQGQALHTFRPEDLTVGRKTYEIGDITVHADGITVQLK